MVGGVDEGWDRVRLFGRPRASAPTKCGCFAGMYVRWYSPVGCSGGDLRLGVVSNGTYV